MSIDIQQILLRQAEQLKDTQDIASYLTQAINNPDPTAMAQGMHTVILAKGIQQIASATGVEPDTLYRALLPELGMASEERYMICKAIAQQLLQQMRQII